MSCIDPEVSRRLQEEGRDHGPQWERHLVACASCRELYAAVASGTRTDDLLVHPQATTLVLYDEDPDSLDPRSREWIENHLASCTGCSDALIQVPGGTVPFTVHSQVAEIAPARPGRTRSRFWPLAAAAGWVLVAVLTVRSFSENPAEADPAAVPLTLQELTLSATRGETATEVLPTTDVLVITLQLGEEIPLGARLEFALAAADGTLVRTWSAEVQIRDEFDRPRFHLRRSALPSGPLILKVKTPSGLEAEYRFGL